MPMDIRQAVVAACMTVGQSFMVQAHQVQNCGVKVVDVNRIATDVDAMIVRFTVGGPRFDPCTRQP